MVYQWKDGARIKCDANIAGRICAEMEAAGELTARNLVEASRPADAPLHNEFEWNNTAAADKWREHQARNIINSIVLVNEQDKEQSVRAYFKLEARTPTYESIVSIVQQEDKYAALKEAALRELSAFQRKYSQITEFEKLFAVIAELGG